MAFKIALTIKIMKTKQEKKVYLSKVFHQLKKEDIVYLRSDLNYTQVYLVDGTKYLFSYTLKRYDDFFKENDNFIRIHRAVIVNKKHIEAANKYSVTMKTGHELPLARRRTI